MLYHTVYPAYILRLPIIATLSSPDSGHQFLMWNSSKRNRNAARPHLTMFYLQTVVMAKRTTKLRNE